MFARLTDTQLAEYFDAQIHRLDRHELNDNGIDGRVISLTNGVELDQNLKSSLIERYDIVFLYLEALQLSGVTNMYSGWVKHLLRYEFSTLRKSEDTLYLCWAAFSLIRRDIDDNPNSIAFQRKTRRYFQGRNDTDRIE